jgi:hypothetical protein
MFAMVSRARDAPRASIGADADVGFAWSGGGDDAGAASSYGVMTTIAKFFNIAGLNVELSLPIFRLDFIPWRGADGFDRRSGWHPR